MLAVPDYEVKFFMDPRVALDADQKPTRRVRDMFNSSDASTRISMQFMDGPNGELHGARWNVRLRKFEGEDQIELTYKKRYPVTHDIDTTLAEAARDGFDSGEDDYEAQVEWGAKQTLSLSRRHEVELPGYEKMQLPSEDDSRSVSVDKIPGKLDKVDPRGWAQTILAHARSRGPVQGRRWTGEWQQIRVCIEVWGIRGAPGEPDEYIVELSFKDADRTHAHTTRCLLHDFLDTQGWLLKTDVLKTELILTRY